MTTSSCVTWRYIDYTKQQSMTTCTCIMWNMPRMLLEDVDKQQPTTNNFKFMCYMKYTHVLYEDIDNNIQ